MKRPIVVWIIYAVCVLAMAGTMLWVSDKTLRLEQQERITAVQAENERLALWRMESALVPLIAQENARPANSYDSDGNSPLEFLAPPTTSDTTETTPAGEAPTTTTSAESAGEDAEPAAVSEILGWPLISFHFQFDDNGALLLQNLTTDPEAAERSEALAGKVEEFRQTLSFRKDELSKNALLVEIDNNWINQSAANDLSNVGQYGNPAADQPQIENPQPQQLQQQKRNFDEYARRIQNTLQNNGALAQTPMNQMAYTNTGHPGLAELVQLSPLVAVWKSDRLMLIRSVKRSQGSVVQGCLLDWDKLRHTLTKQIADLLPDAQLEPVLQSNQAGDPLQLASLPVRLIPGRAWIPPPPEWSPMRITLAVAWAWLVAAAFSIAMLLVGVVRLSERRAAFVSAVTHELRTPLTTFQLYTDMLCDQPNLPREQTNDYARTLRNESTRLSHLVENVLAYSRLEQSNQSLAPVPIRLSDLLGDLRSSLESRTAQAGATLKFDPELQDLENIAVLSERGAFERIISNLVDNCCKYGMGAERRMQIEVLAGQHRVAVRIRDWGPGIPLKLRQRMFSAFSKSATDAARSAPGVGLGLSLARRLARNLGGDLVYEPAENGTVFCLWLSRA